MIAGAARGPRPTAASVVSGAARGPRPTAASVVSRSARGASGQASVLLVGALAALLVGVLVLGAVARGVAREAAAQRAVDLAALAGARAMHEANPRLFEPATIGGVPNPRHLTRDAYLALARDAAERVARANGAKHARVEFPDGATFAPVRIRVAAREVVEVRRGEERRRVPIAVAAEAELAPVMVDVATGGGYDGPLAHRQGKPMRPDVALAFDRMAEAAREDGVTLLVTSGYRSDAEQAELFRLHPDPKWVAPPGTSLHRNGTELDLGPRSAYAWLAANATRFHFIQRYDARALALRICAEPALVAAARHGRRRPPGQRGAGLRASTLRADARARRAALERVGGAARRPDLRREQLQPVRAEPGGRPGDRAVHARHGGGDGPRRPVRRRARRSTPRRT